MMGQITSADRLRNLACSFENDAFVRSVAFLGGWQKPSLPASWDLCETAVVFAIADFAWLTGGLTGEERNVKTTH
jgi:hypothetical protein